VLIERGKEKSTVCIHVKIPIANDSLPFMSTSSYQPFSFSPRTQMPRVVPAAHRRGHSQLSDARTLHDRDLSSSGRRHHGRLHCRGGEPTLSFTIRTHAALTSHGQRLEWKRWLGREWRWHGGWGRHMTMMVHVICVQSTHMKR